MPTHGVRRAWSDASCDAELVLAATGSTRRASRSRRLFLRDRVALLLLLGAQRRDLGRVLLRAWACAAADLRRAARPLPVAASRSAASARRATRPRPAAASDMCARYFVPRTRPARCRRRAPRRSIDTPSSPRYMRGGRVGRPPLGLVELRARWLRPGLERRPPRAVSRSISACSAPMRASTSPDLRVEPGDRGVEVAGAGCGSRRARAAPRLPPRWPRRSPPGARRTRGSVGVGTPATGASPVADDERERRATTQHRAERPDAGVPHTGIVGNTTHHQQQRRD